MAGEQQRSIEIGAEKLLLLLGKTNDSDPVAQVELSQHIYRATQLALAAIHDEQVRQDREGQIHFFTYDMLLLGGLPAFEATGEHLLHAGKIIRASDGLDVEMAVHVLAGRALFKDDHAAH